MTNGPQFGLLVSSRWRIDLERWLAREGGRAPSKKFSGAALEAEVALLAEERSWGEGLPVEPLLPWLQRYAKAVTELQQSRATTVVVSWQRSPLALHLTRTGNTEALLSLHGVPAGESLWRLPVTMGRLREALAEVAEEMVEALEGIEGGWVASEISDWLEALVEGLAAAPLAAPLATLRGRRDPRTIEIATSDSGGRSLVTRLRHLEPALLYAGEPVANAGVVALAGEATLSASFGGSRRWEGNVLERWASLGEELLRQPPDALVGGEAALDEMLAVEPLTADDLASLVGEHLSGLTEALLREQPLLEVHEAFASLRTLAVALRRHGSGRWQPVAPRRPQRSVVQPALPEREQPVTPARLRQMGYHRHWTVSLPPGGGRSGGLVWSDAAVAVASPRGLEATLLSSGEQAWRAESRARGRWVAAGAGIFALGEHGLLRQRWSDGGSATAPWPIPSDRLAAAAEVAGGALCLSESGILARWNEASSSVRWSSATGVSGACGLLAGRSSALVVGSDGEAVRIGLQRGAVVDEWVLPWSVRRSFQLGALAWVEGYAQEAVVLGIDDGSRSPRIAVEGEVAELWAMADGQLGRLAEGGSGWLFEVWSLAGAVPERVCLLRLAAELVAGRNVVALRDGILIAVRDGLIRFGVEAGRVVERWRRPLSDDEGGEPVRLVVDAAEAFVVELTGEVTVRALQTGRVLHTMAALWEQAQEARLQADGSLFVVEPSGRGGSVLHGLPAPGWLGLVG